MRGWTTWFFMTCPIIPKCVCPCVWEEKVCVQYSRMCVHFCVCHEHLTAKDLKSRESILLMRVLELGEEGLKTSHPVLSICLSHLFTSPFLLLLSLPSLSSLPSQSQYISLLSFHLLFVVLIIFVALPPPLLLSLHFLDPQAGIR